MNLDPHNRGLHRLRDFNYAIATAYYVTICTHVRACVLSRIEGGIVMLTEAGHIVELHWRNLSKHHRISQDTFVVMPNHVHGILFLQPAGVSGKVTESVTTLSDIIRDFKKFSALEINKIQGRTGRPFWQRNYYERVIRNDMELERFRKYITENPLKWGTDEENPEYVRMAGQ